MYSLLFSSAMFVLLSTLAPGSGAVLLEPDKAPETGFPLSPEQWGDSDLLKQVVAMLKRGERLQAKTRLAEFLKQSPDDPRGPDLAGTILLEEKNYRVAALSFRRALSLNPNNPGTLSKLGVALLLDGKRNEGEQNLRRAVALRPGEPLARRYLGWLDEGRGNLEGASNHYLAAISGGDLPPDTVTGVHLALGRVYNALGRYEDTVKLLAPMVRGSSAQGDAGQAARLQLAFAYLDLKRNAEAAPLIARLQRELKPDNPELRFLKAYSQRDSNPAGAREALRALALADRAYFARARMLVARIHADQGNQTAAAKELEALAAEVDKTGDRAELPAVLRALAAVQVSAGKPAEAASVLDGYAQKYPDLPSISYLLAQLRLQTGDAAGAQSALKSLIARHADDAPAYALAGQIARSRNSLAEAEMNLQKALALDSSLVPARIDLAGVYVSRKDWAKAEATLKEGIDRNRGDAALQYELAGVYDAAGRWQDANLYYRSVLRADPDHVPSLNNLALNLAEQSGDLAAAKTYAEKAFRLDNTDPTVQDTYGWILVLGNDTKNGLPLLQRAARAFPKDSTVSYHLGAALIKAGRLPEGKRLVQDALTSGLPENLRAKAQSLVD